eukprot:TRINITY_DN11824_c0_g1_i1.p1 TRINITY_DN11824_c0_g1~~TRINITY_DN11824_c0_g1_i1.p1  ORF type:complete len:503 (+),score=82.08 TRINITY_DN11824_c0_g1_i1:60-1511(+)
MCIRDRYYTILALWCQFVNTHTEDSSTLKILEPQDFSIGADANIEFNLANFGRVPWGTNTIGLVYISDPIDACSSIDVPIDDSTAAPFLIARRGGCTFVSKAHFAQIHGFKTLIIVDNKRETTQQVEMIDDSTGSGESVDITTMLITLDDGEAIIKKAKELEAAQQHRIALITRFKWPKVERVRYEIWTSSCNSAASVFMKAYAPYGQKLEQSAEFNLNFIFWPCDNCNTVKQTRCISDGAYCAPDPDGEGPIQGYETLIEDLRQYCIHQIDKVKFWDYVVQFADCVAGFGEGDLRSIRECSVKKIHEVGLSNAEIDRCIDETFIRPDNENVDYFKHQNKLFRYYKERYQAKPVVFWPSIIINNMTFKGNLEAKDIAQSVCNAFINVPDICTSPDFKKYYFGESEPEENGIKFIVFVIALSILLLLFMCGFYFIYRRLVRRQLTKEMTIQINQAVSQYFLMNDPTRRSQPVSDQASSATLTSP